MIRTLNRTLLNEEEHFIDEQQLEIERIQTRYNRAKDLYIAGQLDKDMYDAFNMGIGFVITVRPYDVEKVEKILTSQNQPFYRIGQVVKGDRGVELNY